MNNIIDGVHLFRRLIQRSIIHFRWNLLMANNIALHDFGYQLVMLLHDIILQYKSSHGNEGLYCICPLLSFAAAQSFQHYCPPIAHFSLKHTHFSYSFVSIKVPQD